MTALLSFGLPAIALLLLVGAGLAFLYLPVIGHGLAAILVAMSAGVFAYDAGYRERGSLDQSAALSVQIKQLKVNADELQRQAAAARQIADDAAIAQHSAEDIAAINQKKAADYENELAKRPISGCNLDGSDVDGLRGIGAGPGHFNAP